MVASKSYFFRLPINVLIRQTKSQPIVTTTAKEFMFSYDSPLTSLGHKILPNWISFEKVGIIDRVSVLSGILCGCGYNVNILSLRCTILEVTSRHFTPVTQIPMSGDCMNHSEDRLIYRNGTTRIAITYRMHLMAPNSRASLIQMKN